MGDGLPPGLPWEEAGLVWADRQVRARLAWGTLNGRVTACGPLRQTSTEAARDLAKMRRNLFASVRREGHPPYSLSRVLEGVE